MPTARAPIAFGGLANTDDTTKTPAGNAYDMQNATVLGGVLQGRSGYVLDSERASSASSDIGWGLGYGQASQNEIQRFQVTGGVPTSGVFQVQLTFGGSTQTTANLNWNCTADEFRTAIENLSNVEYGDVNVTGGPFPGTDIYVEFIGLMGLQDITLCTITGSTLNNSASVTVSEHVKGGSYQMLLMAVQTSNSSSKQTRIYEKNLLTNSSWSEIDSGLVNGFWQFVQYEDLLLGGSPKGGTFQRRLGAAVTVSGSAPITPTVFPSSYIRVESARNSVSLTGASFSGTGFSGTVTYSVISGELLRMDSNLAENGARTVVITLSADQDHQFSDVMFYSPGSASPVSPPVEDNIQWERTTATSGSTYAEDEVLYPGLRTLLFWDTGRSVRSKLKKVTVGIAAESPAGATAWTGYFGAYSFGGWPYHRKGEWDYDTSGNPIKNVTDKPVYAYTYVETATGLESRLGPSASTTDTIPPAPKGHRFKLDAWVPAGYASTHKVQFYRKQKGSNVFKKLPNADGSYGVSCAGVSASGGLLSTSTAGAFYDRWMEQELDNVPSYVTETERFSGEQPIDALAVWKGSFVKSSRRVVYCSQIGDHTVFAENPDDQVPKLTQQTAETLDRPRSDYPSQDRSDPIIGLIGNDSLYMAGVAGVYALVGDRPAGARGPRKLPEAEGALSYGSCASLAGGALVAGATGLNFFSVGRAWNGEENGSMTRTEETAALRNSWAWLTQFTTTVSSGATSATQALASVANINVGDQLRFQNGTTATVLSISGNNVTLDQSIATTTSWTVTRVPHIVVVYHKDEVWVFSGKRFIKQNRRRQWEQGTLAHGVRSAVSVPDYGLYFLGVNGKLYRMDSTVYTDAGTAINYTYTTPEIQVETPGGRARITKIEADYDKGSSGTLAVQVTSYDGAIEESETISFASNATPANERRFPAKSKHFRPGVRYKLSFSGVAGQDKVESCWLWLESEQGAQGN